MRVLLFWVAGACAAFASTAGPGEEALGFMEKVKRSTVNLEPGADTALSSHTTETKKREIARRLARISKDLEGGKLELGPVKTDGDLAAVIVRKAGGFDPSGLRVFSVGLVKRGEKWRVAPVPASFDNAGLGYTPESRNRLEELEMWMLREQHLDLERLRGISLQRIRREIGETLSPGMLRKMTVREMGEAFVTACEEGDEARLLGLLGGLSPDFPEDWGRRLEAVKAMKRGNFGNIRRWKLMAAKEVLRVLVHEETNGNEGLFTIACLDPAGMRPPDFAPVELVHFELFRDEGGLWRVDPPESFYEENVDGEDEGEDGFDRDLIEAFPLELRKKYPAKASESAEVAWSAFRGALAGREMREVMAAVVFPERQEDARWAAGEAAALWWSLNERGGSRFLVPLAFREGGDEAVAVCQIFSGREPERADLRMLWFSKKKDGWMWRATGGSEELREWSEAQVREWSGKWQQVFLVDTVMLDEIAPERAASEDEARGVVTAFLAAMATNDIPGALGRVAWLSDAKGAGRMLRNLGFEMVAARRGGRQPEVVEVCVGEFWSLVGVRMGQAEASEYPLYPVVMTEKGWRILLEVDLILSKKRGRNFLNGAAMDRLAEYAEPAVVEELRGFYKTFEEKMKPEKE